MISYDWLTLDEIMDDFANRGWEFVCDGDTKRAVLDGSLG